MNWLLFQLINCWFVHLADEGGVCARFHEVLEDGKVEWQSHNTGVVNFAYNNRELPSQVAKLALVHEIGHSLGSPVSTQLH